MPLFLRIQGDCVRLNLAGANRGHARVFIGRIVPLCLSRCSESRDLFNLSGRAATP